MNRTRRSYVKSYLLSSLVMNRSEKKIWSPSMNTVIFESRTYQMWHGRHPFRREVTNEDSRLTIPNTENIQRLYGAAQMRQRIPGGNSSGILMTPSSSLRTSYRRHVKDPGTGGGHLRTGVPLSPATGYWESIKYNNMPKFMDLQPALMQQWYSHIYIVWKKNIF